MTKSPESGASPDSPRQRALAEIAAALDSLSYGTITITIHDSKLVQIEVTEKKRFQK